MAKIDRCTGKERFASMPLAAGVAKLSMRRREGLRRHAYHCGECGGFHVGSSTVRGSGEADFKRERQELRLREAEFA